MLDMVAAANHPVLDSAVEITRLESRMESRCRRCFSRVEFVEPRDAGSMRNCSFIMGKCGESPPGEAPDEE